MNTQQAIQLVTGELSRRSRIGHVVLLVVTTCLCTAVVSLWATEPQLPLRTHLAFAGIAGVAAAWIVHAVRVLRMRSVFLVPHQVHAARLSVLCTTLFTLGAIAIWWQSRVVGAAVAAATGLMLTAVAAGIWRRVSVRRQQMRARLQQLEGGAK